MMKRSVYAATLLLLIGFAGTAIADGGNKVSIAFYFPANNQGIFAMVGAGDAHGATEVTSGLVYPDPNGNGRRVTTTKVLHFPDGDVYMSTDGVFMATATTRESSGTWMLTGGTGAFANVSGGGKYHFYRDVATGNLAGAYSGKMKLDEKPDKSDD